MTLDVGSWGGRSVVVTGHTGFKGSWLALWLHRLGAAVHGYSLDPLGSPAMFEVAGVRQLLASDFRADLADLERVKASFAVAQPEVIFHLAAQPLVRESYRDPIGTLATNVMGTAHVLEAARCTSSVRAVVVVTTDKVYENRESHDAYRESDSLGGHDPYSASKAAAEIVAASYRSSFFSSSLRPAHIATVRAGNVIGGGDWATDRLVPDCMRAFARRESVHLRFPRAVRPWQHVTEPLAGYLQLASRLLSTDGAAFAKAWNFGPDSSAEVTVGEVADHVAALWGDGACIVHEPSDANPHEAGLLQLDSGLARTALLWKPRWALLQALERTVSWQRAWLRGEDMAAFSMGQIGNYEAAA